MERSYIAFISYRHLPLEMATAKKLHKRIERYVIPRELRSGTKKPGLVFRDQDELPISSNLSENIQQALDCSQFLIVICTPETAKSLWVQREISYFLEHHDRDHVLAVLADGTPETAFPPQLTELRSAEGELFDQIEPLAANIVADSAAKRARLFRIESLRILASLIGCPFDALYKREQRFRRRRIAVALSVAALVAAAFIGMLLERNAEIREQLQRALANESKTLASLSEQAYREGDYNGAIQSALQALPDEEHERPYVPEAEYALSRELDLYRRDVLRYARSMDQESVITSAALSSDGKRLVTADEYGTLRCFSLDSGQSLWQHRGEPVFALRFFGAEESLLVLTPGGVFTLDTRSGETIWTREDIGMLDLTALSPDDRLGLATAFLAPEGSEETVSLIDLETGLTVTEKTLSDGTPRLCVASVFSSDASRVALLLQRPEGGAADLLLWETKSGKLNVLAEDLVYSAGAVSYRLAFTSRGELILACDDRGGQSYARLYDSGKSWSLRYETPLDTEKVTLETGGGASAFAGIDLLDTAAGKLVYGCKHELYMLDASDGEIIWHRTLPGYLLAGRVYGNACMALVLDNGTVSFCTDEGYLSDSMGIYNFRSGYNLSLAAIAGENYPESSVVLVSENFPQRASLVRFVDNPQMVTAGSFSSSVSRICLITSPSGAQAVAIGYDPAGRAAETLLLDSETRDENAVNAPEENCGWDDPGLLELTEKGELISPKGVFDLHTRSFTPFACEGVVSAADMAAKRIASAGILTGKESRIVFYSNGLQTADYPCPEGKWHVETIGRCGTALICSADGKLALCTEQGEWNELPAGTAGSAFAIGTQKAMLAVWNGEDLILLNLDRGTRTVTESLPATTVRLLFSEDDEELFALSETGELCVIQCSDGELLYRAQFSALGLRFRTDGARCTLTSTVNEDRVLLFCDDPSRSEALCLVYDRESRGCAGVYDAVAAYLPGSDSVLVCPIMDGVCLSPFYSREEVIAAAEAVLSGETP